MTEIPLTELGGDSARRDRYGRYLIIPPNGTKPEPYTRVTTVAKALDEGGGLAPWKATMTACGIIMRRGLRAQWEALLATTGDPWYANKKSKAECKRLVEECSAVGGANDRREVGSALHAITALVDQGETPTRLTEETERDVKAYHEGLAAAGIAIVPGAVELAVVLDGWQIAGTFDRLAIVPDFDLPLIADLKTGADLSYSWQSIAIQLAAYSRAEAVYEQGTAADGSDDRRLPMPPVDQDWGLIMWLNAGTGELELFLVDLNAGWQAFEHSMWARGWRNAKVAHPIEDRPPLPTKPDDLLEQLTASVEAIHHAKIPELLPWLQNRIDCIGQHPSARADLGSVWPTDLPTLRAFTAHTPEQLAVIERLLDGVEKRHQLPFPPERPDREAAAVAQVVDLFPGTTTTQPKGSAT
jgi:hypothetical protein